MTYAMSANYPILDQNGYALENGKGIAEGYIVVDSNGEVVPVKGANLSDYYDGVNNPSWDDYLANLGYKSEKRYTTAVTDASGYYTVYVKKA